MSKYVPPAKRNSASGISQNKLFVGNLTGTTTKQDLVDLFAKIAAPLEVSIINPGFNKQKTIAFVTFANTVDLNEICLKMKLTMLNGILLEISLPKDKQLGFGSKGNHDFVKGNCLRCSSPGHISRNCPVAESSCYKCGGEHLGRYCIGKYAFIERITIPDAEYPDVNFVGMLLGPRASMLKNIMNNSGAKVVIRGNGSNCVTGDALVDQTQLYVEMGADLESAISKFIDSCISDQTDLKQKQLWEHAYRKGSARVNPRSINSGKCYRCSKFGHLSRNCSAELASCEILTLSKEKYPAVNLETFFKPNNELLLKDIQDECKCFTELTESTSAFHGPEILVRIEANAQEAIDRCRAKIMELVDNAMLSHSLEQTKLE